MIPDSSQDEKIIEKLNEFDYWFDIAEDGSSLQVKIVFEHPLEFSQGFELDIIEVEFANLTDFKSTTYSKQLDPNYIRVYA